MSTSTSTPFEPEHKEQEPEHKEQQPAGGVAQIDGERWIRKKEHDKQAAEAAAAAKQNNHQQPFFLRRQSDGVNAASTIPGTLGGSPQIPEVTVGRQALALRQQPLVNAKALDNLIPIYVAVSRDLHPNAPNSQIGVTRAKSGTVNLDIEGFLKESKLPPNYPKIN